MKVFRAILALYVLVWFNVVIPGHTRGVITLEPGAKQVKADGGCCQSHSEKSPEDNAGSDRQRHCAICFVAATYTAATPLVIDLRPAGHVVAAVVVLEYRVPSLNYPPAFYPTGPPQA